MHQNAARCTKIEFIKVRGENIYRCEKSISALEIFNPQVDSLALKNWVALKIYIFAN